MSEKVLLVGGPLDGERRPYPRDDDGVAVWFDDGHVALPGAAGVPIPAGTGKHRYVKTFIMVHGGSSGTVIVYRYGDLARLEALDMLVAHYPDRRSFGTPASLGDPA